MKPIFENTELGKRICERFCLNFVLVDGAELEDLMFNFSNDEVWENFLQVIECLATMHAMLRPDVTSGED